MSIVNAIDAMAERVVAVQHVKTVSSRSDGLLQVGW
jgi:hypothetical protein